MAALGNLLSCLWGILLVALGSYAFWLELRNFLKNAEPPDKDDGVDMMQLYLLGFIGPFGLLLLRFTGGAIALLLITTAIPLASGRSNLAPGALTVASVLGLIVFTRVAFLKFTFFKPNRNTSLVGPEQFDLVGQKGTVEKDVSATVPGSVRIKNDVIDCFASEDIKAGTLVKVTEVDCGLVKVEKASSD